MNQDNITGTDVRTMLLLRGYDLTPSTKDWSYIYNKDSKKVEVTDFKKGEIAGALDYTPIDLTEIKKDRYLIGEGQNPIEQAVKTLCNLETLSEYDEIMAKTTSDKGDLVKYKEYLELFSPNNTLYVSNGFVLTNNQQHTKDRVVFLDKTVHVPAISSSYNLSSLKLPESILSSDNSNTTLLTDANIKFINPADVTKLVITDDNTLTLGTAISSSKMQTISFEITKVVHNVKVNASTLEGVKVKDNLSFDKLVISEGKLSTSSSVADINSAIDWDGGLGLIDKISVTITRTAKVCYYSEKGLIAYGTKEIISELTDVSYFNYQNLLNSIN